MRFVRVVSAAASCQPNCPEWVSAEGQIDVGTAQVFARFIAGLGGRRLPILISSPGGSTSDAMAMGRLIRAQHLVVAVARTNLSPCPNGVANCSPTPGAATAYGAYCIFGVHTGPRRRRPALRKRRVARSASIRSGSGRRRW